MDICKCPGDNCPKKDFCKRFVLRGSERQNYFNGAPNKDGHCDYFMPTKEYFTWLPPDEQK